MLLRSTLAALIALATLAPPALAQIRPPKTIAYQGLLTDATGQPVADGAYAITLSLFHVATGGTASYVETHSVTTAGGVFAVLIGGGTATTGTFAEYSFALAGWVEVAVGGTTLAPRTALHAVPYARSLTAGAEITGSVPISTSSGPGAVIDVLNNSNTTGAIGILSIAWSADGGRGIVGIASALTGATSGVYGSSNSSSGRGVYGRASASSGTTYGVYGVASSPSGYGVYGEGQLGTGVYGRGTGSSGLSTGVLGQTSSSEGRGVYGEALATSGSSYGVYGQSASASGHGVYGHASSSFGNTYGVYGLSGSTSGRGVYGEVTRTAGFAYGVHGQSASSNGRGVFGDATSTTGTTYGIRGDAVSPNGYGALGYNGASTGSAIGVRGSSLTSPDGIGVSGSGNATGVMGSATALSGTTYGVYGSVSSSSGYAGYFTGGRGLFVENSGSSGITTATIRATNFSSSGGIAGWFESKGTDATLVVDQDGSGDIIRGFSSGNLRFRVENGGTVRADGSFIGGGADFAEYVPLASSSDAPQPGDVVGVTAGRVGLATDAAEQVMIVSSNPAFVGNPDAANGGALVALVGQAEVRLASPAQVGDLLVASGASDGTARAVSAARYSPATDGAVIGRVLALAEDGRAIALVGVDEAAALRDVVARQQSELAAQQRQLDDAHRQLDTLTADRDRQQAQIDALVHRLDAQERQPERLATPARR